MNLKNYLKSNIYNVLKEYKADSKINVINSCYLYTTMIAEQGNGLVTKINTSNILVYGGVLFGTNRQLYGKKSVK